MLGRLQSALLLVIWLAIVVTALTKVLFFMYLGFSSFLHALGDASAMILSILFAVVECGDS